uniref:Uncharacterized protein n=1 Tax=Anguilla anguilla TaxID=7936 RepID=A0A0E9SNQ0_ANGAN
MCVSIKSVAKLCIIKTYPLLETIHVNQVVSYGRMYL